MRKLRWAMDGGFWDLDMSTPVTIDGLARPVPEDPLPLSLTRGASLSRPKQLDFMQRFLIAPFVPCFSGVNGLSLQRVLTIPFGENVFATVLGQFNVQKFMERVKKKLSEDSEETSWVRMAGKQLQDRSLYALNLCAELMLTPNDTLLFSSESTGEAGTPRKKAVYHHEFPQHNLTVEAAWPGLFVDSCGTYWDVPLSMAIDLAPVASDSGSSYHMSLRHNSGTAKPFEGDPAAEVPSTLKPGLCAKSAFSFKKNFELWRSAAPKLRLVQPYDIFISNPHITASGIIGAVMTAALGDNYQRSPVADKPHSYREYRLHASGARSMISADAFATASVTAQYGNFQKPFLDLTRLHARLDIRSGSKFLSAAARVAQDLCNSQPPNTRAVQDMCPSAMVSFQQQLAGPFSFRLDSGIALDFNNGDWKVQVDQPVFAIEHSLYVLGSAKGVFWYSPKKKEFMVELRFFEP
uniref:Uncharacterized protein n=1 Tax=Kalanchoe fedtschenkoi TaxID=63787 RepID=A0A7N0UEG0_KALFE